MRVRFLLSGLTALSLAAGAVSPPLAQAADYTVTAKATQLPAKAGVPTTKAWQLAFPGKAKLADFARITVTRGGRTVAVKSSFAKGVLTVEPVKPYAPGATYELRVAPKSGKAVQLAFTTKAAAPKPKPKPAAPKPSAPKPAPSAPAPALNRDAEPNNLSSQASPITPGARISGALSQTDDRDFYRIALSDAGEWKLTAAPDNPGFFRYALYNQSTNSGKPIFEAMSSLEMKPIGLAAGTYVLKITQEAAGDLAYAFHTSFAPQHNPDDSAATGSVGTAPTLAFGTPVQGRVGYRQDADRRNTVDFYKVVVPKDGDVKIEARSLDGQGLKLTLSAGAVEMQSSVMKRDPLIAERLAAGTYVIGVRSDTHGAYELTVTPR